MKPRDPLWLTAEDLRARYHYDPETGIFCHRLTTNQKKAGDPAGNVSKNGYVRMSVSAAGKWRRVQAHRLAWLYMTGEWPTDEVDHRDGVRTNNRWSNLREATDVQTAINKKLRKDSTTGFKGVYYDPRADKYGARITTRGKTVALGHHATAEQASAAYERAAAQLHGEFARLA